MKTTNRFTYYLGTFSNTNEGNDLYARVLKLLKPSLKGKEGRFSRTRSRNAPAFEVRHHIWA
jgi:hypothetical protein